MSLVLISQTVYNKSSLNFVDERVCNYRLADCFLIFCESDFMRVMFKGIMATVYYLKLLLMWIMLSDSVWYYLNHLQYLFCFLFVRVCVGRGTGWGYFNVGFLWLSTCKTCFLFPHFSVQVPSESVVFLPTTGHPNEQFLWNSQNCTGLPRYWDCCLTEASVAVRTHKRL